MFKTSNLKKKFKFKIKINSQKEENEDKRHQKTAPKSIKRKNYRYSMTTFKNKKNNISKEKRNRIRRL